MSDVKNSVGDKMFRSLAAIEPHEKKAVILGMLGFFCLFGSYSIVKPVRDAMGTVYGIENLQELFTGTFIMSFIFAPIYSALAARVKLSIFLPWVYIFIGATLLGFFALFGLESDRWTAAAFYIWVSTFNVLIISVLWSFLADIFSRQQAKRLFGFIAAGITVGGIAGPAAAAVLVKNVGNGTLMVISAAGFILTAFIVRLLTAEKARMMALAGVEAQQTTVNHTLPGNPLDGFKLLFKSPYLLLLAAFLLLMTWISTVVYFQLGDMITKSFPSREARTQAYAVLDLIVNCAAVFLQLFGTGKIIKRFGVTTGLLLNPVIMVFAFMALILSPVFTVLAGMQIIRRVAEYAVAKPAREMLFTVVDQNSKYKAKNVIDTVVYRFGDVSSAWVSSFILPFGVAGLAVFGLVVCVFWFPIAWKLGKRYESAREGTL